MSLRVLILCATAALAACHEDSDGAPKPATAHRVRAPVAAKAGPTAQELTAGMVEAVTQGKSLTPVALKFDLSQRPLQGQPLVIGIALLPEIAAAPATIRVTGSEGVKLAEGDEQIEFPAVEATQVYRHSIQLTPSAEGVQVLTLSVGLAHDQVVDSRVFSVPIVVAAEAREAGAPGQPAPAQASSMQPAPVQASPLQASKIQAVPLQAGPR
jgi:hypothetical protein